MITNQQRLILINKTTHASGRGLTCNQKQKIQKDSRNLTYTNGETDRLKLKSSPRGSILRSRFFNQTTRKTKLLERNQRAIEKWFLER